ncbi:hypothetical protein LF1_34500 [Rubripirellula obstinata]|uniref:Uncharacterized protein n=1 Tax=Rubripirellula obstinata TaxID=406547 RepID=A0A5B1CID0_9BACT|nr:hypothetical protein [Rubripirellula obstinata]KAA1260908.1 hypothetical protein LF1_34500 [Rubripirellula obstinata]
MSVRVFSVRLAILLIVLTSIVGCTAICSADWQQVDRDALADQFDDAAEKINEDRFPSANGSKRRFLRDYESADRFLSANTSKKNYRAWMKFIAADELVETLHDRDAMKNSQSARKIGREAVALRYRLIGTAPGLELPVLTQLRRSTEDLIDGVRFRDSDRSSQQIAKQMQKFAEDIRDMNANPSADDIASITQMIGLMEASGQSLDLVAQLRQRFGNPNVKVMVSEQVVQSAINRGVNESRPVRDCILGTRIVGTATLGGTVTANVLPAVGSARIEVMMNAAVNSRNVGYNGPVKLNTVSQGQVNVRRMLHVDESGVRAEPVVATASLNSQIVSIDHKLRLVRRIASKRAAEQKPKAERIGAERLRSQVSRQFAEQTDQASSFNAPDPMAKLRPILTRLDLMEPARLWGSTDSDIYVEATVADNDQLSAPSLPSLPSTRPIVGGRYDVALQVHETVVDNLISPILAGRTMTETEINELLSQAGTSQPKPEPKSAAPSILQTEDDSMSLEDDESDADEDEPPFEIDFARLRPIVFEARDQSIKLGIRGTRFSQGRRELKQSLEITANYLPTRMDDGSMMLIRTGDVEVDFPSRRRRLSVSQTGLKTTIEKKFANVFPEMLLHRPLQVPPTVKMEAIAGRSFRPQSIDARDGWVTITVIR